VVDDDNDDDDDALLLLTLLFPTLSLLLNDVTIANANAVSADDDDNSFCIDDDRVGVEVQVKSIITGCPPNFFFVSVAAAAAAELL